MRGWNERFARKAFCFVSIVGKRREYLERLVNNLAVNAVENL